MSECKTCGRDDGHWLGCAKAAHSVETIVHNTTPAPAGDLCIQDGCSEPQRSADKRVKYCDAHSDPKNRK